MGLSQFGRDVYGSPVEEARRCRTSCAVFDFSFVNRASIKGDQALDILHRFQSRNLNSMTIGKIVYALREDNADANFQVISDLTIWKTAHCCYEVYSGHRQDIEDLRAIASDSTDFQDLSENTRIYAVQGPESLNVLKQLNPSSGLRSLPYFHSQKEWLAGVDCLVGRLGYTGEAGFEIVVEGDRDTEILWDELLRNAQPGGMIAADILRIEAGFILFLNECRLQANTTELGIGNFTEREQTRSRYRLICFECRCDHDLLPYAATANLIPPKIGEIAITSVNRTQFTKMAIGFGFINICDVERTVFSDPLRLFHQIMRAQRPYFDFHKTRPRRHW